MDYSGANSLFLRTLIDKKYTLPYKAIDALVKHFLRLDWRRKKTTAFRFKTDERSLPVLWHQALLALVQRYKTDIVPEQRTAILELVKVQSSDKTDLSGQVPLSDHSGDPSRASARG